MVVVREKTTVTQRVHGACPTHSRTEISVRDVKAVIDEPKEREGTNMGPTPTETMVAALIACTNVISHKCAKKHGVKFKAMTIDAESTFDRRGTQLLEEIEVPFPKIRLLINVTTSASEADIEKVKADLHRRPSYWSSDRSLRRRRERPCRRRAAEKRDELAPFHSITSSARQHYRAGAAATVHRPAPIIVVAMPSFIVDPA